VFLGIGLAAVNDLGTGAAVSGVINAVDYIAKLRQAKDLSKLPVGRRIVVIGGGMTAIDIASQTKRLGAEEVTIVYRRGPAQMGASAYEQELAQTDGVLIRHWMQPKKLVAKGGRLIGVELEYTRQKNGRLTGTGETLRLACDQLFKAIGQKLEIEDRARERPDQGRQRAAHLDPQCLGGGRLRGGRQGFDRHGRRGRKDRGPVDRSAFESDDIGDSGLTEISHGQSHEPILRNQVTQSILACLSAADRQAI
jgi:hypothetical protein